MLDDLECNREWLEALVKTREEYNNGTWNPANVIPIQLNACDYQAWADNRFVKLAKRVRDYYEENEGIPGEAADAAKRYPDQARAVRVPYKLTPKPKRQRETTA